VRAANTGVTCFVNRYGRVTQVLQDANHSTFTEGVLSGTVEVPRSSQLTFYTQHGELFAEICTGLTILFIVLRMVQVVRQKRTVVPNGAEGGVEGSRHETFQVTSRDPSTPLRSAQDDHG
jgi:cobalamin biosynthesis protein CobD/CbiB